MGRVGEQGLGEQSPPPKCYGNVNFQEILWLWLPHPPQSGQLTDPLGKGHLVQARKKIEAGSWAYSTALCAAWRSTRGGPLCI